MRRVLALVLLLTAVITAAVWAVNHYVPFMEPPGGNSGLLLIAIFCLVLTFFASLKDTIELFASIFGEPHSSNDSVRHNLPQGDYKPFIGRAKELAQVHTLLEPASRHFVITIDGIGGVGKTTLALEAASHYKNWSKRQRRTEGFHAIVWTTAKRTHLTATGITSQAQSMHTVDDVCDAIGVVLEKPRENGDLERRVEQIRVALANVRTLLVIDNLETVDDEGIRTFIRDVPPPTKVIVTTRHRIDTAYPIRLLGMSEEEARQFIGAEAEKKGVTLTNAQIERLITRTGGIPLAIAWSIGRIALGQPVETVISQLGDPGSDVAKFCFKAAVGDISGTPAYHILFALAMLAAPSTRAALGTMLELSDADRDDGIVTLEKLSLINRNADRFEVLPLTRAYLTYELDKTPRLWRTAMAPMLKVYLKSFGERDFAPGLFDYENSSYLARGFVEPTVRPLGTAPAGTERDSRDADGVPAEVSPPLTALEALRSTSKAVLFGDLGSGKTTVLRRLGLQELENPEGRVPIFVPLRHVTGTGATGIRAFITERFRAAKVEQPLEVSERLLGTGNAIVMLDGLDEAPTTDHGALWAEIETLSKRYATSSFVVTTRPSNNDRLPVGYQGFALDPLNLQQVRSIAEQWFAKDPDASRNLMEILSSTAWAAVLAQSPLLVGFLCYTFEHERRLPRSPTRLIASVVDDLINREQRKRLPHGTRESLSSQTELAWLARVAAKAVERDQAVFTRELMKTSALEVFDYDGPFEKAAEAADEFVSQVGSRHTLIVSEPLGVFRFVSVTFQEYLAARFFLEQVDVMTPIDLAAAGRWPGVFVHTVALAPDGPLFMTRAMDRMNKLLSQDAAFHAELKKVQQAGTTIEGPLEQFWPRARAGVQDLAREKNDAKLRQAVNAFAAIGDTFVLALGEIQVVENRRHLETRFRDLFSA